MAGPSTRSLEMLVLQAHRAKGIRYPASNQKDCFKTWYSYALRRGEVVKVEKTEVLEGWIWWWLGYRMDVTHPNTRGRRIVFRGEVVIYCGSQQTEHNFPYLPPSSFPLLPRVMPCTPYTTPSFARSPLTWNMESLGRVISGKSEKSFKARRQGETEEEFELRPSNSNSTKSKRTLSTLTGRTLSSRKGDPSQPQQPQASGRAVDNLHSNRNQFLDSAHTNFDQTHPSHDANSPLHEHAQPHRTRAKNNTRVNEAEQEQNGSHSNDSAIDDTLPSPPRPLAFLPPQYFLPRRRWYLLTSLRILLLALLFTLSPLSTHLLTHFTPSLQSTLSLTPAQASHLSNPSCWTTVLGTLLSIPLALYTDRSLCRAKTLAAISCLGSIALIGLAHAKSYPQLLLARLAVTISYAGIEALATSLVSDLLPWPWVFLGESVLCVGLYIPNAVAGDISRWLESSGWEWRMGITAVGLVGVLVAMGVVFGVEEPRRQRGIVARGDWDDGEGEGDARPTALSLDRPPVWERARTECKNAWKFVRGTCTHMMLLRSLWVVVLSGALLLSAMNMFEELMPGYLSNVYHEQKRVRRTYEYILGATGSASVLSGGFITFTIWRDADCLSSWKCRAAPLWFAAAGGLTSCVFYTIAIFAQNGRPKDAGIVLLYATFSIAVLLSKTWRGSFSTLIIGLLPMEHKTFGFALCAAIGWVVSSSGPMVLKLAMRNIDIKSERYVATVQACLGVIPTAYCMGAFVGLVSAAFFLRTDMEDANVLGKELGSVKKWTIVGTVGGVSAVGVVLLALDIVWLPL
ncbi:major facilitator superfamily domain-containing protein [Clohesyomyces aquaticus]|uniref:Major facilitator superfamily domain-containing protein n=1 Tax=Clohesyomyces aquaticus TaxID=1231657 RepID=A0A1Y1ZU75_9PLEO|nr:major facilitator superfamily domain-containing protein [Clohesyomyces aquaticus]